MTGLAKVRILKELLIPIRYCFLDVKQGIANSCCGFKIHGGRDAPILILSTPVFVTERRDKTEPMIGFSNCMLVPFGLKPMRKHTQKYAHLIYPAGCCHVSNFISLNFVHPLDLMCFKYTMFVLICFWHIRKIKKKLKPLDVLISSLSTLSHLREPIFLICYLKNDLLRNDTEQVS